MEVLVTISDCAGEVARLDGVLKQVEAQLLHQKKYVKIKSTLVFEVTN